jgi:plastocyanin
MRTHVLTRTTIVLTFVLALVGCSGAERSGDVREGPAEGDAVRIEMQDNTFSPSELEVPGGEPVTVELTNAGNAVHDFTVAALDVSTGPLAAGEQVTVTLSPLGNDTAFECTLHGGMEGTFTVA